MVIDAATKRIIATVFGKGRRHDYYLFKKAKLPILSTTTIIADSGYQGLQKIHGRTILPKKKTKGNQLSAEDKKHNHENASRRVPVEHVISRIKRFKIFKDQYRNRRKRFNLRFNLIAGIYNYEL